MVCLREIHLTLRCSEEQCIFVHCTLCPFRIFLQVGFVGSLSFTSAEGKNMTKLS